MRPSAIPYTRRLLWTSSSLNFVIYVACLEQGGALELIYRKPAEVRCR